MIVKNANQLVKKKINAKELKKIVMRDDIKYIEVASLEPRLAKKILNLLLERKVDVNEVYKIWKRVLVPVRLVRNILLQMGYLTVNELLWEK